MPSHNAKAAEAAAIRICRELHRLEKGHTLYDHDAHKIEKRLGITPAAAADAYEYGAWMRWLQGVGDPVSSLRLLKAGRNMIAESQRRNGGRRVPGPIQ